MDNPVYLLQDYLIDSARRLPDKVALVCQGQRLTYANIDAQTDALAQSLVRMGVQRGDRVMVFGENTAETALSFWAALKANAVATLVNPLTKTDKLAYLISDCRPSALISDGRLLPVLAPAVAQTKHIKTVILFGALDEARAQTLPGLLSWSQAVAHDGRTHAPSRCNIDVDLAAIIYTSGSTGEPKGVMLTHRNMLTAAASVTSLLRNVEDDVILTALPLAFNYSLYQMIMAFRTGARLVLERNFAYPAQVMNQVVEEGVTGFPGVPTVFALLAEMKMLDPAAFARVRYVTNTAAALSLKHITMLRRLFPRAAVFSMYGLTECKRCTCLPPERLADKPDSVGIAIPNTELWIVDENDRRLGPNQVGQLVIRGATVMKGYWEKPEATARKLRPGPVPGEQVLYTGDYARLDEEGFLYFVGRMDDIIKSRGEKVAPKEVEAVLCNIAGVREAAVIGVPDTLLGQAVKAFVVREPGASVSEKDIMHACHEHLESYMVPQHLVFVSDLPKTTTGKIKKTELA
jgi:amino acid adenylation domain-containing protein